MTNAERQLVGRSRRTRHQRKLFQMGLHSTHCGDIFRSAYRLRPQKMKLCARRGFGAGEFLHPPRFCPGRIFETRRKRRFSPKSIVCFRNLLISKRLSVRVGHSCLPTRTGREKAGFLCETHSLWREIPSLQGSLRGMIKSRKSLSYRGQFTKENRGSILID